LNNIKKYYYLIKLLKKGNTHAFNEIYRIYVKKVYYFTFKFTHNHNISEEIVQEVFFKLWQYKENIKNELSFESLIFTITLNQIRKYFRKKKILEKFINQSNFITNYNYNIDYIQLSEIIDTLIERLPEQRRKIFIKSRLQGLSNEEIANELNLSKKTIENQLTSALKFIRTYLEKYFKFIIFLIYLI